MYYLVPWIFITIYIKQTSRVLFHLFRLWTMKLPRSKLRSIVMGETNLEQTISLYILKSATISRAVVCGLIKGSELNFLIITIGTFRFQFFLLNYLTWKLIEKHTKLFNLKVDRKTYLYFEYETHFCADS